MSTKSKKRSLGLPHTSLCLLRQFAATLSTRTGAHNASYVVAVRFQTFPERETNYNVELSDHQRLCFFLCELG